MDENDTDGSGNCSGPLITRLKIGYQVLGWVSTLRVVDVGGGIGGEGCPSRRSEERRVGKECVP